MSMYTKSMTGPDDRTHDDMRALFGDYARGKLDDWQRARTDRVQLRELRAVAAAV